MRMDRAGNYVGAVATALPFATLGLIIVASMSWDAQTVPSHVAPTVPKVESVVSDKIPACTSNIARLALDADCLLEFQTRTGAP